MADRKLKSNMADFLREICKNKSLTFKCQNKRNKMFNLEFFRCLEKHIFPSWVQFLWAEGPSGHVLLLGTTLGMGRTPGPCNFSGKLPECWALSLNLWAAGQGSWALTWLESAGEGWGRLDRAPGPIWAWISW